MTLSDPGLWIVPSALVCLVLLLLHPLLTKLLKLLFRSSIGLAFLYLLDAAVPIPGISLGVNPVNALILGLLGVPGFGFLLMLQWLLR